MTEILALGIETSCDETAVGVVSISGDNLRVLTSAVSTQVDLHAAYGGVVPELASREHLRNLPLVLEQALSEASIELEDLTCIGVTVGPGLKGCLLIGSLFAQGLSLRNNVPLLGVNHLEGHLLSGFLTNQELSFPFVVLIVSGGHTEIHIARALGEYELVARTIDDAAGEAFDKSAALLGFGYPGGPALAHCGDSISSSRYAFPIPMQGSANFSFSGLKTSISLQVQSVRKHVS
jgi:N6-L-threonylcarbamoyladenine synthase